MLVEVEMVMAVVVVVVVVVVAKLVTLLILLIVATKVGLVGVVVQESLLHCKALEPLAPALSAPRHGLGPPLPISATAAGSG